MSCSVHGCVRALGHPSFHTTIDVLDIRLDSIEHAIAVAVNHQRTDSEWKNEVFPGPEVM
jgi:hypothetical protein